jgi:hypothetical protein
MTQEDLQHELTHERNTDEHDALWQAISQREDETLALRNELEDLKNFTRVIYYLGATKR